MHSMHEYSVGRIHPASPYACSRIPLKLFQYMNRRNASTRKDIPGIQSTFLRADLYRSYVENLIFYTNDPS